MINLISQFAAPCKGNFFGLTPWYEYLKLNSKCEVVNFNIFPSGGETSDVPLILLAVTDSLLRLAGMVAVAFVIYGAFQYVTSQGEPERSARAQSTILNALIGLAVALIAVAAISFVGRRIG